MPTITIHSDYWTASVRQLCDELAALGKTGVRVPIDSVTIMRVSAPNATSDGSGSVHLVPRDELKSLLESVVEFRKAAERLAGTMQGIRKDGGG